VQDGCVKNCCGKQTGGYILSGDSSLLLLLLFMTNFNELPPAAGFITDDDSLRVVGAADM